MAQMQNIDVARIAILPEHNFSRGQDTSKWFKTAQDQNTVLMSLVPGWDPGDGLAVVTPLAGDLVDRAMQVRKALLASFEKDVTDYERDIPASCLPGQSEKRKVRYTGSDFQVVAKKLFHDKDGKTVEPDLDLVCTFRRMASWLEAQVIRHRLGLPILTEIPVEVRSYKNRLERVEDNLSENELKFVGSLPTTRNQKAIAVYDHIWCLGGKQVDARRVMKDGTGQWCWELCRANDKYPALNIMDGIRKDTIKKLSRVRADQLRKLIDAGVSNEDIQAYFNNPGEGNAFKMMKKSDIQSLAERCPNPFFRAMAKAIYKDNPSILAPLLDPTPVDGVPFKDILRKNLIATLTETFAAAGREDAAIQWLEAASK